MWVSWWTKRNLGRFFSGFLPFSPATNVITLFFYPHLTHFVSFHFIRLCNGATGVVGWHPCFSLAFNIGVSSHLIIRPGPFSDTIWYCFINVTRHSKLCYTVLRSVTDLLSQCPLVLIIPGCHKNGHSGFINSNLRRFSIYAKKLHAAGFVL